MEGAEARGILILRRNLRVTAKREIEQILKIERMQLEGEKGHIILTPLLASIWNTISLMGANWYFAV